LRITALGSVDDDEMMKFTRRLIGDAGVPSDCSKLVDLCGLDESTVSPSIVRQAADLLSSHGLPSGEARVAMVAGRDFAYGLARMYQSYRSMAPERFRVFRDRAEALAWLGVAKPVSP
jgi:hypothetical protein